MIRIGTAGWTIPRESAPDFPTRGTHLQRYAARFSAVEINSSFYRPHRPQTYARWAENVGPEFRFSVKVPKRVTHALRLQNAAAEMEQFLAEVLALGEQLGALLVQLPPSLAYEPATVRGFLAHLREHYAGAIVVEPRHASWCAAEVEEMLRQYDVGRVAADPDPTACGFSPTGSPRLQYYRLHGSPRVYYSAYTTGYLQNVARTLVTKHATQATKQTTVAETSASERAGEVWCLFDNTAGGHAAADALKLQSMLRAVSAGGNAVSVSGSDNSVDNNPLVSHHQELIMAKKAATKKAPKKGAKKSATKGATQKAAMKKGAKKSAPKKSAPKKPAPKKSAKKAAKRELIAPHGDKRYIRRDERGRIKESDDVSRSLSQDRRRTAKKTAEPGQGDKGDRKPASDSK